MISVGSEQRQRRRRWRRSTTNKQWISINFVEKHTNTHTCTRWGAGLCLQHAWCCVSNCIKMQQLHTQSFSNLRTSTCTYIHTYLCTYLCTYIHAYVFHYHKTISHFYFINGWQCCKTLHANYNARCVRYTRYCWRAVKRTPFTLPTKHTALCRSQSPNSSIDGVLFILAKFPLQKAKLLCTRTQTYLHMYACIQYHDCLWLCAWVFVFYAVCRRFCIVLPA